MCVLSEKSDHDIIALETDDKVMRNMYHTKKTEGIMEDGLKKFYKVDWEEIKKSKRCSRYL